MATKDRTGNSTASREDVDRQRLIDHVIARALRALDADDDSETDADDDSGTEAANELFHELINIACRAINETHILLFMMSPAMENAKITWKTPGVIAAGVFVHEAATVLRRLLGEADLASIEERLGRRLDQLLENPDGRDSTLLYAREGASQWHELAACLVHFVLARFGGPSNRKA